MSYDLVLLAVSGSITLLVKIDSQAREPSPEDAMSQQ